MPPAVVGVTFLSIEQPEALHLRLIGEWAAAGVPSAEIERRLADLHVPSERIKSLTRAAAMGTAAHEMRMRALWWFLGSAFVLMIAFATRTVAGCFIALAASVAVFALPIHYLERGRRYAAELAVWRDLAAILEARPPRDVHFRKHRRLRLVIVALFLSVPVGALFVGYAVQIARRNAPWFVWIAAIVCAGVFLVGATSRPAGLQLHVARWGVLADAEIVETNGRRSQGRMAASGVMNIFANVLTNAPEWSALVRFTVDGRRYESLKRFRFEPEVGDRVPVIYDPQNPIVNCCPEELSDVDLSTPRRIKGAMTPM